MKSNKKKVITGWVHDINIYSYTNIRTWGKQYIATGTTIYRKKRFDTPYKIRVITERIK